MKENINYIDLYKKLFRYYGPQGWWPAASDFQMMISAILVQRTNWKNVELALANLGNTITAGDLIRMEEAELAEKIRPSGFYRMKARKIRAWLHWFQKYDFSIDRVRKLKQDTLRQELLAVHGIGEETADAMLLYAFDKPGFIADNYARRLFTRIGYDIPKAYHAFKRQVEAVFPDELDRHQEFHALIVEHGKQYCKKVPSCKSCPLTTACRMGREITGKR